MNDLGKSNRVNLLAQSMRTRVSIVYSLSVILLVAVCAMLRKLILPALPGAYELTLVSDAAAAPTFDSFRVRA